MKRQISLSVFTAVLAALFAPSAQAQLGQLNAGGGGNGGGGGQTTQAEAGSTTEGIGGVTTQGIGGSQSQDGGIAGGNIAEQFVGGNNSGGFVGGGIQTQINNLRTFQAIASGQLPTGGTFDTSGTPRRVPTSLRIAFDYPRPQGNSLLAGSGQSTDLQLVTVARPELEAVRVQVDPAGTAVLSGFVPSADVRRLAANLIRLRPGVRRVENHLAIATHQHSQP